MIDNWNLFGYWCLMFVVYIDELSLRLGCYRIEWVHLYSC